MMVGVSIAVSVLLLTETGGFGPDQKKRKEVKTETSQP